MDENVLNTIKNLDGHIIRFLCQKKDSSEVSKMSASQLKIINYIVNNPQREIYQKDIELLLGYRRSTISNILTTMEKNNIIRRTTGTKDNKQKVISLTKKIKNKIDEITKKVIEIEEIITKDIDEEELKIFFKIIKKMENNLKNNE